MNRGTASQVDTLPNGMVITYILKGEVEAKIL